MDQDWEREWMERYRALLRERIAKRERQRALSPNTGKTSGHRLDRSRIPGQGLDAIFRAVVQADIEFEIVRNKQSIRDWVDKMFSGGNEIREGRC